MEDPSCSTNFVSIISFANTYFFSGLCDIKH